MNSNLSKPVWIVNKSNKTIDRLDLDLKRHFILKPLVPLRLPIYVALKYVKQFTAVSICEDVDTYFKDKSLKTIIIRDAGIGDLILLEPIIRKLSKLQKHHITIATCYPDVFENHPNVNNVIKMKDKHDIKEINVENFDSYEDLRSYSETCVSRNKKNRTDIYNEKWLLDLKDEEKEPRLYLDEKLKKNILKKKKGRDYIGISFDASHSYRKLEHYQEIIDYILNIDEKNVIVLLGHYRYVQLKPNKRIIDLQGKTSIKESFFVIRDLDYMIAADSGLMHVAMTMHIPTISLFSIITPHFRLQHYRGEYKALTNKKLDCLGCGDWHMIECKYGSKKKDPTFIPPCMKWTGKEIYDELLQLSKTDKNVYYNNGHKEDFKLPDAQIIAKPTQAKFVLPIIVQNEEHNLPRFIENVINNHMIGQVYAIDGGSTDNTVKLLEKAGAKVYVHPYDKNYHDMQAMQRNYSCSFVKDDEKVIIMDIDECFSDELSNYLPIMIELKIEYALLSRRTFNYYNEITDVNKRIKDYPDWQPRFFTWNRRFKWVGSPHHNIYNAPQPIRIQKDILHFEKEGKDRNALEKQWSEMQKKSKEVYV